MGKKQSAESANFCCMNSPSRILYTIRRYTIFYVTEKNGTWPIVFLRRFKDRLRTSGENPAIFSIPDLTFRLIETSIFYRASLRVLFYWKEKRQSSVELRLAPNFLYFFQPPFSALCQQDYPPPPVPLELTTPRIFFRTYRRIARSLSWRTGRSRGWNHENFIGFVYLRADASKKYCSTVLRGGRSTRIWAGSYNFYTATRTCFNINIRNYSKLMSQYFIIFKLYLIIFKVSLA